MFADHNTVLTNFKPVQLSTPKNQSEILDYFAWVIACHRCNKQKVRDAREAQRIMDEVKTAVWSFGISPEHIRARQVNAMPDSISTTGDKPKLPDLMRLEDGPQGAGLGHKMRRYKELSGRAFEQLYAGDDASVTRPTSVIHVTCAGYLSPSPAQEFVSKRGWHDTGVTHSYHMGCYGAFPPIKMASGYLANRSLNAVGGVSEQQVDIVHTELLSLHGDYSTLDPGTLVNMTLFADGFIKYSAMPKDRLNGASGFEIVSQYETIIPHSHDEMTWTPSGRLFEMYLAKTVPLRIKQNIRPFITELCRRAGIDLGRDVQDLYFAIHPGGPKILDHIKLELGISEQQMHWSREVLSELGNMSSSTVPQIWARMLDDIPTDSLVVSMAFGPGLTATGLVLKKV